MTNLYEELGLADPSRMDIYNRTADLAFERALGVARGLAAGISSPSELTRGGLQAVRGHPPHVRTRFGRPGPVLAPSIQPST
jgi:hypothetical protein